jgi:predicted  nucleic acid-binding Zn-ribbon protein
MGVEFSNAYQEILLDNLVAIIKQNFVFQTQLKLAENSGKVKEELQLKYNELVKAHEVLNQQLLNAQNVKIQSDLSSAMHEEKSRIQSALNDVMKRKNGLEKELEEKKSEIENIKNYVSKLESLVPQSKLKKINSVNVSEVKKVENVEIKSVTENTSSF